MMALPSNPDSLTASASEAAETARDERYLEAAALYGAPLERMARAYEADPSRRQDLLQDVHVAIWRSLLTFDGRCSLRTWVYRVAHYTATKHMLANRRVRTMNGNTVWQSQSREAPRISLQYVRRQSDRLNSDIRRELRFGYFGTVLCALGWGFLAFAPAPGWSTVGIPAPIALVVQLTALLSLLACGYITFQIHRRGKLQRAVEHEQVLQSLHAYRTALERRRDHYSSAWRWSLWPVIPGVIVILGGGWLFDERPGKWLRLSLAAVVCALAFLIGVWVSRRKSAGFQRELDALKTLDENAP